MKSFPPGMIKNSTLKAMVPSNGDDVVADQHEASTWPAPDMKYFAIFETLAAGIASAAERCQCPFLRRMPIISASPLTGDESVRASC